jgi:hypothetical protein
MDMIYYITGEIIKFGNALDGAHIMNIIILMIFWKQSCMSLVMRGLAETGKECIISIGLNVFIWIK